MQPLNRISRSLLLAVMLWGCAGGAAFAQANEEFYRGKTLQIGSMIKLSVADVASRRRGALEASLAAVG